MTGKAENRHPHYRRTSGGFTLIEVLIALVVMSVGMFGIAGLYLHSIQAGRTSVFRHHAITLAGDVADRIRANPAAGVLYESAGKDNGCMNGTRECSAQEMAENDVMAWQAQAAASLPSGAVSITFSDNASPTPDEYEIEITWSEPGINTTPSYSIEVPVNNFAGP